MATRTPFLLAFPFAMLCMLVTGRSFADTVEFRLADGSGSVGTLVSTSVEATSAAGLGAFQLNVMYDAGILQPESVEPAGEINALVDFKVLSPGTLRVAFASSSGVEESGPIIKIDWKVLGSEGESSVLTVSEIRAWEQKSSFELPVQTTSGEFKVVSVESEVGGSPTTGNSDDATQLNASPALIALVALGVIIVALLLVLVLRKPKLAT